MQFNPEAMRKRFHELKAQVDEIEARSKPLRDRYTEVSQAAEVQLKVLSDEFKVIEAPLYDMKMELGALARALNGKTGKVPE